MQKIYYLHVPAAIARVHRGEHHGARVDRVSLARRRARRSSRRGGGRSRLDVHLRRADDGAAVGEAAVGHVLGLVGHAAHAHAVLWRSWSPRISCCAVRSRTRRCATRYSAVLGVLAALLIPFIHLSVYLFQARLHPMPVALKPGEPSMSPEMMCDVLSVDDGILDSVHRIHSCALSRERAARPRGTTPEDYDAA